VRAELGLPVVVGFGIDSPDKARAAAAEVDGVVVGTALVREVEAGRDPSKLVAALRAGLDQA
jgi:tryptophan synthase alpha chain